MTTDINYDNHHPYFKTIVEYNWLHGIPVIYRNDEGKLIQHWSDGRIDYLTDIDEDEPFEDDGAYADD
jgi:hypothetical protein